MVTSEGDLTPKEKFRLERERTDRQYGLVFSLLIVGLIILVVILPVMQMYENTSTDIAKRAVEDLDYSNVQILQKQETNGLGTRVGCEIDDDTRFVISAINKEGLTVPLYVCVAGIKATVYF